jgi:hypothetical protein
MTEKTLDHLSKSKEAFDGKMERRKQQGIP